ncbi:MAG: hypothetical protein ACOZQL_38395 [Myxococcota bacterium]
MGVKRDLQSAAAWEAELNKERAGALGATARKLEAALQSCRELSVKIDDTLDPDLRALLLRDYRETREEAERQRWNLCVQREAMGLRRHDDVDRHYPPVPKR